MGGGFFSADFTSWALALCLRTKPGATEPRRLNRRRMEGSRVWGVYSMGRTIHVFGDVHVARDGLGSSSNSTINQCQVKSSQVPFAP